MKVLCICQGGNSRSVACAYVLKYFFNQDALACSQEKNTPETIEMLCSWADHICVMQPQFGEVVPEKYREKVTVIDVGPDVWCNGLHPDLVNKVGMLLDENFDF